ncbi:TPA: hypothetical protein NIA45_006740 [Pseudomonas aeruginosa]|nr:hypothetical protein [Pseudomonas aeruginosa]
MTVAELIETLKGFPADLEVVVEGYETGLDPIHQVKSAEITRNPGLGDWAGITGFQEWDGEYALASEIPGNTENPREAVAILGRRGDRRI